MTECYTLEHLIVAEYLALRITVTFLQQYANRNCYDYAEVSISHRRAKNI
jgi:hypothetical protein